MNIDFNALAQTAMTALTQVGMKILGAIVIWIVGRWLIRLASNIISTALNKRNLDKTIVQFIHSSVTGLLSIALIIALLGFFGVETTTFAALLAAAGIAIGAAWSGLLSNFAAGIFLVILRPFKIDDFVSAGGMLGTVTAIGLFGTTINTPDNIQTIVGNAKIFSDTIQNFSTNPFRRVDLVAQLDHSTDHNAAIGLLKEGMSRIPNVLQSPAPDVEILTFTLAGPVLAVRPFCAQPDYWQVYFDTNKLIRESFGAAGFATPENHLAIRNLQG